ncbi:MAG: hypothetical protein IH591_05695 [Bacteroidales bacterium]|nr:hypothetical protein [Bacteroidales bacterium]
MKAKFLLLMAIVISAVSCVKETYDMNRLSEKMKLNPTLAISAGRGEVNLGDLIKPNDTVFFDEENLLKLWIREDSVVNISLDSLIDFGDVFSFMESYPIGEVKIADNISTYNLSLGQIAENFDPVLEAQFQSLDDGSAHNFPAFPSTNTGVHTFAAFTNFQYAIFSGGQLNIKISNNLTAPLTGIRITLRNGDDNSPIGTQVVVPAIPAGGISNASIDLTGKRVYGTVKAEVIIDGSPGTASPVLIQMTDKVVFELTGTGLEVESGRLIVPSQTLGDAGSTEIVTFDPGNDMEITELALTEGTINWTIESQVDVRADLTVTLPTITRSGTVFTENIAVNRLATSTGSFSAGNLIALMNTHLPQPYNALPAEYSIVVSSQGDMIDFSAVDSIKFEASIDGLVIDYVKGFFGQMSEEIESDTIDLEIDDIIDRITGEFRFTDPSFTLDYSNSFGLPVEITLNGVGKKNDQTVDLDLDPFVLSYPVYPARDMADQFIINKLNSKLPELISMPPTSIIFSGGAGLNPEGNSGARDNIIYGDSRFVAALEAQVPMDLWINNLQFADTLENFMKPKDENSDFSPEDLQYVRLDLTVTNGFPLGVSVQIILHDSITPRDIYTLDVPGIIEAAPVNTSGRVTSTTEKVNMIVLEKEFFEAARIADEVIVVFTLNTTGSGSQSVKIYSDYSISFKAGIVVRPDLIVN